MNELSFANPWILGALAAAGLPVLIHYLTRAKPRRIEFPPFRFLEEACAGKQAVHRLRTFILLTLRTLAILALVLLFSRPFLKPTGASASADASKRVVVLLDASLSMRAVQQGTPLFAKAQGEAAEVLRALEPESEAAVILMGATPRPLLPALSRNIPALHDSLVKTQPTFEAGNPAAALALAARMLGNSGTLYIFSDFQESNWKNAGELPSGLTCRLRRVTDNPVENAALTAVKLSPAEPVAGESVHVTCSVFNSSAKARQETVRLDLGGYAQEAKVTVQPFATADASFQVTFTEAGPASGKATLEPDDLRDDDTRFVAVRVHKTVQTLFVTDSNPEDHNSPAFFVTHALKPSTNAAPGLALTRRHGQDTDRGILETADVFILCAPVMPSGEVVEIISRRVVDGAQLIVLLDNPLATSLTPAPFTPPFQLVRQVQSDPADTLANGPRKLFADATESDWSAIPLRRHWQCVMNPGHENDVMLQYPDGSPALTLTPLGKGAVVFVNLPLTPDGGDLIGNPLFPSMLHEILRLLRQGSEAEAIHPGSPWTLDVPVAGDAPVVVTDPEAKPIPANVVSSGRLTRLAMSAANVPGLFTARQGERIAAIGAVNVDSSESDTRPIPMEQIKPGKNTMLSTARNEEDLLEGGRTRPLWPGLAAAAIIFLALEMVLLAFWKPGRSTQGGRE
jgi:hypothetical protein